MDLNQNVDLPKLDLLIEEQKNFFLTIANLLVIAVCVPFTIFWHYLNVSFQSNACLTSSIIALILLTQARFKISFKIAAYITLVSPTITTYVAIVQFWKEFPIIAAFLPLIVSASWILLGRRVATNWAWASLVMIISAPLMSPYFHETLQYDKAIISWFNAGLVISILGSSYCVYFLYEKLSNMLVVELMNIKQKLEHSQTELVNIQNARDRFFASISHEIRTPMNAVRGIAELLSHDKKMSSENTQLIYFLHRSSTHLLSLINDLLDLSKLEENKVKLTPSDFDLHEVIYDAYNMLRYTAEDKRIELRQNIDSKLPKYIHADPNRLRQVLLNLLNNAIKFTPVGYVLLDCKYKIDADNKKYLHICVKDTGIGMSEEDKRNVFSDYAQANEQISQKYGGTGLGLNITKRIVELQGGHISFESEAGKGSTFNVELPISPAMSLATPHSKDELLEANNIKLDKPCTIMLVEDNQLNIMVAKKLLSLQAPQIKFLLAENGQVALDLLNAGEKPDIILMDMQMPVMDGLEATRAIRAHENMSISTLPIIAMTANASDFDMQKCKDAGMNDFTSKPVDSKVLVRKILNFL